MTAGPLTADSERGRASGQVVLDFFAAVLAGPVGASEVLSRLTTDFVDHDPVGGDSGPTGVATKLAGLWSMLPDARYRVLRAVAAADMVAVESVLEATGVSVPFADFYRVKDGRISEHWHVTDGDELARQLAARPS